MAFRVVTATGSRVAMVAHVPHSSTAVPTKFRAQILLDDRALARELLRMTDWHTDQLFAGARDLGATMFVNEISRLVVDPERFPDDVDEPAAAVGQGAVYTRTSDGAEFRRLGPGERQALIDRVYVPYHSGLTALVANVAEEFDRCLVLDCHSFGTVPLPSELDQSTDRPDICIGTDPFHTPRSMARSLAAAFTEEGFRSRINRPFGGALVPMPFYGKDRRITAVMVEVRRGLYCDESSGEPLPTFGSVKRAITRAMSAAGLPRGLH